MSQLFVDNIKNRTGGAVGFPTGVVVTGVATFNNQVSIAGTLTYEDVTNVDSTGIITAKSGVKVTGGEILVGSGFSVGQAGIVTASGIRVGTAITIDATSGIITATSFSGPFSASTGSFTSDVDIADKIVHTGDTNTAIRFPAADTFTVETAGSEALRVDSGGRLLVGTDTAQTLPTASALQVSGDGFPGSSIRQTRFESGNSGPSLILAHARGSEASNAILNDDDELGKIRFYGHDGVDFNNWGAEIKALVDGTPGSDDMPGRLMFLTTADGGTQPTERLRITSRGGFQFSNGFMSETVKINTTARNGTQTVDLVDGMVHYFSTNSSGTWKPNFTMTGDDINATIATGDVFSPTMIVAKGATTHFANAIQVDGSDVTPEFSGGAPTDGGGSGTFDVYNYTIIKTGDDTFKAFAAVSTYE
jgi:hypothetical protein